MSRWRAAALVVASLSSLLLVPAAQASVGPAAVAVSISDHIVVPAGWTIVSSEDGTDLGLGTQILEATSGDVVGAWWQGTHRATLQSDTGRSVVVYAHRFDTAEHAEQLWLGVLRLAEEPGFALTPKVIQGIPDSFAFGAVNSVGAQGQEQILTEEAHRVVGRDVIILISPDADISESLPSPTLRSALLAHQARFPQDHFDLPAPSSPGEEGDARRLLLLVLGIAGVAIAVSLVLLWRKRPFPDD